MVGTPASDGTSTTSSRSNVLLLDNESTRGMVPSSAGHDQEDKDQQDEERPFSFFIDEEVLKRLN